MGCDEEECIYAKKQAEYGEKLVFLAEGHVFQWSYLFHNFGNKGEKCLFSCVSPVYRLLAYLKGGVADFRLHHFLLLGILQERYGEYPYFLDQLKIYD